MCLRNFKIKKELGEKKEKITSLFQLFHNKNPEILVGLAYFVRSKARGLHILHALTCFLRSDLFCTIFDI